MHVIRIVGLLVLLLLQAGLLGCASGVRSPQFRPTEVVAVANRVELPIEVAPIGYPFVTVSVDGKPARLLIDTGAAVNLLTTRFAEANGLVLEPTQFRAIDASGTVTSPGRMARVRSVVFGANRLAANDVDFLVDPLLKLDGLDGLLGMPAFSNGLMSLDIARRRLILEQGTLPPIDNKTVLPLRPYPDGNWLAPIRLAGKEFYVSFDSGYTSTLFVPERLAYRFPGLENRLAFGAVRAWTKTIPQSLAISRSDLSIGHHVIRRPAVNVGRGVDLAVGVAILRNFVVTFDQQGQRVRFVPSAGPGPYFTTPLPLPGLEVDGRTFVVTSVATPSVAALFGIRKGDQITRIEGVPVADFGNAPMPTRSQGRGLTIELKRNGSTLPIYLPVSG